MNLMHENVNPFLYRGMNTVRLAHCIHGGLYSCPSEGDAKLWHSFLFHRMNISALRLYSWLYIHGHE